MINILYIIKKDKADEIKEKYKLQYIANKTEISSGYISQVLNGRRCMKKTAYAICKSLHKSYEVEEFFDEIKR